MKTIKIMLLIIFLTGCSNLNKKEIPWQKSKENLFYIDNLKTGDILVKKKIWYSPISWFGHSAVMVTNSDVGEYPKLGKSYIQTDIINWLYDDKKVVILRYKFFDEKFKKEFLKNINKYKEKIYKITFNKYDENYFYCSKYIWFLYYKTAKETGYDLEFETNKKNIIFPYDLVNMKDFEIILLNKKNGQASILPRISTLSIQKV